MAGGKYLARMDADDIMHPVRLQKQVEYLEAHPEVDVVDSEAYIIDALGNLTGIKLLPQINPDPYSAYKYCLMFHPTVMGRSAWFVDNPYDESFIRAEDYELWCRTCKSSSFARLKQPLHFYRENHRTSRAYLDDYVQGSRSYRKCLLLHGPRMIGWRHTTYLLMRSFCKTEIFRMVTVLGRQNLLISRRSLSLGEQERAKACCELRVSLETSVAGMKQES
jgi:glycosyltransferase involved in cell wall biosynthesis